MPPANVTVKVAFRTSVMMLIWKTTISVEATRQLLTHNAFDIIVTLKIFSFCKVLEEYLMKIQKRNVSIVKTTVCQNTCSVWEIKCKSLRAAFNLNSSKQFVRNLHLLFSLVIKSQLQMGELRVEGVWPFKLLLQNLVAAGIKCRIKGMTSSYLFLLQPVQRQPSFSHENFPSPQEMQKGLSTWWLLHLCNCYTK